MKIICTRISAEWRSILMRIFIDHWTWYCFALCSRIRINLPNELWMTADQIPCVRWWFCFLLLFFYFFYRYSSEVGTFEIEIWLHEIRTNAPTQSNIQNSPISVLDESILDLCVYYSSIMFLFLFLSLWAIEMWPKKKKKQTIFGVEGREN